MGHGDSYFGRVKQRKKKTGGSGKTREMGVLRQRLLVACSRASLPALLFFTQTNQPTDRPTTESSQGNSVHSSKESIYKINENKHRRANLEQKSIKSNSYQSVQSNPRSSSVCLSRSQLCTSSVLTASDKSTAAVVAAAMFSSK